MSFSILFLNGTRPTRLKKPQEKRCLQPTGFVTKCSFLELTKCSFLENVRLKGRHNLLPPQERPADALAQPSAGIFLIFPSHPEAVMNRDHKATTYWPSERRLYRRFPSWEKEAGVCF